MNLSKFIASLVVLSKNQHYFFALDCPCDWSQSGEFADAVFDVQVAFG